MTTPAKPLSPPSGSFTLTHPTQPEKDHIWSSTHTTWGSALPHDIYVKREGYLQNVPVAKSGGMTNWLLTTTDNTSTSSTNITPGTTPGTATDNTTTDSPGTGTGAGAGAGFEREGGRPILSTCESLRKRAVSATTNPDATVTLRHGYVHGIASVFTEPKYRGNGYASRMMGMLGPRLRFHGTNLSPEAGVGVGGGGGGDNYAFKVAMEAVPAGFGEGGKQGEASPLSPLSSPAGIGDNKIRTGGGDGNRNEAGTGQQSLFSVLYSDIGKKFYSAHGWHPFPSMHVSFPPSKEYGVGDGIGAHGPEAVAAAPTIPNGRGTTATTTMTSGATPAVATSESATTTPAPKNTEKSPQITLTTTPLHYHSLPSLCALDEQLLLRELSQPDPPSHSGRRKVRVAVMPDLDSILWHLLREDFMASQLFSRVPMVRGCLVTFTAPSGFSPAATTRTTSVPVPSSSPSETPTMRGGEQQLEGETVLGHMWAIWSRNYYSPDRTDAHKNTLFILRFVVDRPIETTIPHSALLTAFQTIITSAQRQAAEWHAGEVQMWNPPPLIKSLISESGIDNTWTDREVDSIASLMWYGDEKGGNDGEKEEDEVEWVAIEKYAWC